MGPSEKLEALRTRTPGDFAGRGCLGTDAFSLPLAPGHPGISLAYRTKLAHCFLSCQIHPGSFLLNATLNQGAASPYPETPVRIT